MTTPSFEQLRVLALESRRAVEVGTLIRTFGGVPTVAPALREVAVEDDPATVAFGVSLLAGRFDMVIFLTGVGARALLDGVAARHGRDATLAALGATRVVARGPKPLAVLRELGVPVWAIATEPNTWRELLAAVDAAPGGAGLAGARVAVQEYGATHEPLLEALTTRGASVTTVPVYRWALPEDVRPLEEAARALTSGAVDVLLLTTGVQVDHLWQVARPLGLDTALAGALRTVVVASIGPSTTEALRRHGVDADLEPSHPRMGLLVREAAEQAARILARKRP